MKHFNYPCACILMVFSFFLLPSHPTLAQISGYVVSGEDELVIPFAVVRGYVEGGDDVLFEARCDSAGRFCVGEEMLKGEALRVVAYAMGYSATDVLVRPPARDVWIALAPDSTASFEAAVVTASRVQFGADGFNFRLAGDKRMEGKSVLEGLAVLPGIVNLGGELRVNGKEVAEYYINGRKVADLREIESLHASHIEDVKVLYNPSDNREASLTGAIIYMTLKKPERGGYFGQVGSFLHFDGVREVNGGGSAMFFYNVGKWDVYASLNPSCGGGRPHNFTATYGDDGLYQEETRIIGHSKSARLSGAFSVGYALTSQSRFLVYDNFIMEGTWATVTKNLLYTDRRARQTMHSSPIQGLSNDVAAQFNYDGQGNFEMRFEWLRRGSNYHYGQEYLRTRDGQSDELTASDKLHATSGYDIVRIRAEYAFPIIKKILNAKFGGSMGWILRRRKQLDYHHSGNMDLPDASQPDFHTLATQPYAFLTLSGSKGRFFYSGGVNVQHNYTSYTEQGKSKYKNYDTGWQPRLSLLWKVDGDGKYNLRLSYQRRMGDVPYDAIKQSKGWQNATHYTTGNIDLKATRSDVIEAAAMLWNGRLSLSASFTHYSNEIFWEMTRDSEGYFCTRPVNGKGGNVIHFQQTWQWQLVKRLWEMTLYGYQNIYRDNATIGGILYNKTHLQHLYGLHNTFYIKHGWQLRFGGNAEPSYQTSNMKYSSKWNVYGGITKSWSDGKYQWSLTINGRRRRSFYIYNPGYVYVSRPRNSVCFIQTSFTWIFSGGKDFNMNRADSELFYQSIQPRM